MRHLLFLAATLALLGGCATTYTTLPAVDRANLERQLTSGTTPRYLRLSMYVTPFFGDTGKKLLTAFPPEEVELITGPTSGLPVNPGTIQKILPAGTRVRISEVGFPTAYAITARIPYTPRHLTWVHLEVSGEEKTPEHILVLRPNAKTATEFQADLERYVTELPPDQLLGQFTETVRTAIQEKNAVVDMPAAALEMAWGYPERKKKSFEDSAQIEVWSYPGNKRAAHLRDGRVSRVEGAAPR